MNPADGLDKSSGVIGEVPCDDLAALNKGKQREENPSVFSYERPISQTLGTSQPPPRGPFRPAYFPELSRPTWLPEYKPVPNAFGWARVVPQDPPMPRFDMDPNQPFPNRRRTPNPLHVRKSTGPEQMFPANALGKHWIVAGGYDGILLPNPPLTCMLPKGVDNLNAVGNEFGSENSIGSAIMPLGHDRSEPQDGYTSELNLAEIEQLARVHPYRGNIKSSMAGFTNNKLPLTRGVVVKKLKDDDDDISSGITLPDMRKTVRLLVSSLPRLSRGYLADHILRTWKYRGLHSIDDLKVRYPDWTPRTIRRNRISNRGHSNGYRSIGDLAQSDFDSASLKHFAIVNPEKHFKRKNWLIVRHEDYDMRFSIFNHIFKYPELTILVAKYLRIQELLILYSISKPFHHIVRNRLTGVIAAQAHRRARDSARTFPFRCYNKLCLPDPAGQSHPVPARALAGDIRLVPSFKWLLMICYREMVCHEIMAILAEDGVPVPDRCEPVLKKIWFLMDIPDNNRRIGIVQNEAIFSDLDLFFAVTFFVKLDMRFTDPITGSGKDGMRRLLLSQPSLTTLWKTLKRTALTSKLDIIKLFVRWKHRPLPGEEGQAILGIPPDEIGIVQYEAWGRRGSRVPLQRPDELILRESVRRRLRLRAHYTYMFLWGYINPSTNTNFPPPTRTRILDRLEGLEEIMLSKEERDMESFAIRPQAPAQA